MREDIDLQKLFNNYQPSLGSDEEFMSTLSKKLDAVECIRETQQREHRRYRIAMTVTFALGLMLGVGLMFFGMLSPSPFSVAVYSMQSDLLQWFLRNSTFIGFCIFASMLIAGVIGLIFSIIDTLDMKADSVRQIIKEEH